MAPMLPANTSKVKLRTVVMHKLIQASCTVYCNLIFFKKGWGGGGEVGMLLLSRFGDRLIFDGDMKVKKTNPNLVLVLFSHYLYN